MEAVIEIDGKKLSPIKEASAEVSYSRDYVTRLAREGKIVATLIERKWYVDTDSLKSYEAQSLAEAQLRKNHLSEERKQEQNFHKQKEQLEAHRAQKHQHVRRKAVVMAGLVLTFGLMTGAAGQVVFSTQLASVSGEALSLQNFQPAASAQADATDVVFVEELAEPTAVFSTREVQALDANQNGILILPSNAAAEPAEVFSDEVRIETASSGVRTAVLMSNEENVPAREVPFVIVPVKTQQN
jgi:hypothetical protein